MKRGVIRGGFYILWVVGFIFALQLSSFFEGVFQKTAQETYVIFFYRIYLLYFLLGMYAGIPLIQNWRPKIDVTFSLSILLPCLLISLVPQLFNDLNLASYIQVVASMNGILLIKTIFND